MLEALLGDSVELAEMFLLKQRFAVCAEGESGGEKDEQERRAESKG